MVLLHIDLRTIDQTLSRCITKVTVDGEPVHCVACNEERGVALVRVAAKDALPLRDSSRTFPFEEPVGLRRGHVQVVASPKVRAALEARYPATEASEDLALLADREL